MTVGVTLSRLGGGGGGGGGEAPRVAPPRGAGDPGRPEGRIWLLGGEGVAIGEVSGDPHANR